ncbi:MAG: hypothetical protein GY849_02385 [Deltaproteobacteria bacterium]|nr:hypothetical protein [Deltaproteobacteria bacterium]
MAYCTTAGTGNTAETCRQSKGFFTTIYFSDSSTRPEIADEATAKLEATWTALTKSAAGGRIYPVQFKEFEPVEDEAVYYDGQINSVYIRTKAGKDVFKFYSPTDWDKFNLILGSNEVERDMYIVRVTDKNVLRGKWDSTRVKFQFEKAKITKTFQKATVDQPEMLVLSIESLEPEEWTSAATIDASFSAASLPGLLDVKLELNGTASTTVITVDVSDKGTGTVDITDLVTADFLVKDAGGSPLVVTAVHTGSGTYTLTGTFTTSTTCTVTLNTPAIMDKLYEAYNILDAPIP